LIRNARELKRIASLVIPPAWTDVWICPDPRGHLQATGRDARGRKQYRYHREWRHSRDETKYDRMPAFAAVLPRIRARTDADLARPGLPREKVLATVVRLLEKSLIRVGNEEYVRANKSFGLTTLRDNHVSVRGSTMQFEFRGKSGVRRSVAVNDRRLARIVSNCRDLPGQELFQYIDGDGRRCDVGSADVNAYLKEISGADFTAKDFRTWAGTVLACAAFREMAVARSSSPQPRASKQPGTRQVAKRVVQAIDAVAGLLGNTRAVCRKSYIHPTIIDAYVGGTLDEVLARPRSSARRRGGLSADEAAVLAILETKGRRQIGKQAA
jgi:DNA topoisomerase-1